MRVERMIPAKPAVWADRIFFPYVMHLFHRHFQRICLLGEVPRCEAQLPLLLLPNHSTWWDGFFVYLLNKKIFCRQPYMMMLEEQLRRYPFFVKLGVFSINPHSAIGVRASLRYAAGLMQQIRPLLLGFFPQGELRPWNTRPLGYQRGLEILLKMSGGKVNLLNVAIKIEFRNERLPEAFFLFDQNRIVSCHDFLRSQDLEKIEEGLLSELTQRIRRGEQGRVLVGRASS